MPPTISHLRGEAVGDAVSYHSLDVSCPLATYADKNRWRVWTRNQATVKGWYRENMIRIREGLGKQRDLQQEGCR